VVFSPGGSPVLRINRRDGDVPDVIDLDFTDWIPHPSGNDVAIAPVIKRVDQTIHKLSFAQTDTFLTRERAVEVDLGLGDDVVMVGRFMNHQGVTENKAAVRFGNISMMPEPIYNRAILKHQLSYAVEMRSRTGFSGGVVAAYRTPATVLTKVKASSFFGILGVNWGYILDEDGENTWLNGVVPAWEILETLNVPALIKAQDLATEWWKQMKKNEGGAELAVHTNRAAGGVPSVKLEPPATGENPQHKEDFTSLLDAAVRKPPQAE
jgi:hypothetical protein